MVMIVWQLDLQLHVQLTVPITTKVVSSNPIHGEVYSLQHYVIKLVSDLRQVCGFLRVHTVSSTNKIDRHNITEILLKVALNTKDYQFGICCFSTKHTACERAKTEWHGIKIRCWSGATCLSMDCFFSELAQ